MNAKIPEFFILLKRSYICYYIICMTVPLSFIFHVVCEINTQYLLPVYNLLCFPQLIEFESCFSRILMAHNMKSKHTSEKRMISMSSFYNQTSFQSIHKAKTFLNYFRLKIPFSSFLNTILAL